MSAMAIYRQPTTPSSWTRIIGTVDANLRIVTHLPVIKVGRGDGFSTTKRGKFLTREDVLGFLESGAVQFVVADIGAPPSSIPDVPGPASRRNLPN